MRRKILVIEHHDEPRDDLASLYLPELGFVPEWYRPFAGEALPELDEDTAGAVVLGGAPNVDQMDQYPYLRDESRWIEQCLKQDIPILGLCLGAQLLAHVLGASVAPHTEGAEEFGLYPVAPVEPGSAFRVPITFLRSSFTAGDSRFQRGLRPLPSEIFSPTRLFATEPKSLAPSFTPNARWRFCADGRR